MPIVVATATIMKRPPEPRTATAFCWRNWRHCLCLCQRCCRDWISP